MDAITAGVGWIWSHHRVRIAYARNDYTCTDVVCLRIASMVAVLKDAALLGMVADVAYVEIASGCVRKSPAIRTCLSLIWSWSWKLMPPKSAKVCRYTYNTVYCIHYVCVSACVFVCVCVVS